ncbi:MAG: hypothetical protein Q9163_004399, partial [Psora crenata]
PAQQQQPAVGASTSSHHHKPTYIDTHLPNLRANFGLSDQITTPFLSRSSTSTPGIPGGTSNHLGYFHLPLNLNTGLSGATPITASWPDSSQPHNRPPSPLRTHQARHVHGQPSSTRPALHGHDHPQSPEPLPLTTSSSNPLDLQTTLHISYSGGLSLSLTAMILLDYPMPSFVGIPLKLNITGLSFDGVGLLAYLHGREKKKGAEKREDDGDSRGKIKFCFLSPEDARMMFGSEASEDTLDGHGHGHLKAADKGQGKLGGLLGEIRVESEIGRQEDGKQVLKNVGKVERFILAQVRRIFEDEFVFPSFWTFLRGLRRVVTPREVLWEYDMKTFRKNIGAKPGLVSQLIAWTKGTVKFRSKDDMADRPDRSLNLLEANSQISSLSASEASQASDEETSRVSMVIGLLVLAGIPTTIGVAEGIARRDEENNPKSSADEEEQMRKFNLECYCENSRGQASTINGGRIVLKHGKMYIEPPTSTTKAHQLEGFYIEYPDPDRPKPPPLGLVSTVTDDHPPMLNWIYVDKGTREVKHGNRSQSKTHIVGPWGWDAGEEGGAGGLTLEGVEGGVAVETENGWEVRWEDKNGRFGSRGKQVLKISLERKMLQPTDEDEPKSGRMNGPPEETRTDTKMELTKTRFEGSRETTRPKQPAHVVKANAGKGQPIKTGEPKLEVSSSTIQRPIKGA